VDRSARPFFSEEVTQLRLTLEGVTNAEDEQRAKVEILGVVGAGAALALEGEVAPFAEPFYLDLEGRLRDFNVPRTNPYLRRLLEWTASSGQLTTRVHYRIVGQHLEATNEVIVERLSVEPASESPDRLVGLPLGLVVSLLKDRRGEIRLTIPLQGRVTAPEWSFGDALGTAFKNVITRLVTGPFRAIGRVFQRGDGEDDLAVEINPIVFEPGTAALPPDAQKQIQRVADFLRASPHVRLGVSAAVSGDDRAALRAQRITARVQEIQRRQEIEDFDEAARRLYAREFPGQPPPATAEAAMPILANALPRPDPAVDRLAARRIEAIREALVNAAGIEPERIVARDAPVSISADEGRVQFDLLPST
jgi:hypothetical protein